MVKYKYDADTMIEKIREKWSPEDFLQATENLIAADSLKDMDETVSNLEKGKVSKPIDLSDF